MARQTVVRAEVASRAGGAYWDRANRISRLEHGDGRAQLRGTRLEPLCRARRGGCGMTRAVDKFTMPKRYDLISSVIRNNILSGRLPPGFVLLEGPIANLTQSSRAPVQAALRILEKERLVRRFQGRGYLGRPRRRAGRTAAPRHQGNRPAHLGRNRRGPAEPRHVGDGLRHGRGSPWPSCLIFGEFRIIETELGDHLGVSRTVVRDVLSRLHESGLIRKNQSSHWIAGPLTAASVRNLFDIRSILEPEALRMAGPYIDYAEIERMLAHARPERTAPEAETLEQVLMDPASPARPIPSWSTSSRATACR